MFEEPPVRPDDTRPTTTVPILNAPPPRRRGPGLFGVISLGGAFVFFVSTLVVLLADPQTGPPNEQVVIADTDAPPATATLPQPTSAAQGATATPTLAVAMPEVLPTVDSGLIAQLLEQPVQAAGGPNPFVISRDGLDPFTIIPDRPRNAVIEYVIQRGDTVSDIAQRFGLEQNSIAWSNDRRQLWTLIPGDILYIPPVDGVAHVAVGDATIRDIAEYYKVDDPYVVIDSEYNQLKGYTPDMVPPVGMRVFIPGGTGENINWSPPIVQGTSGGSGAGASAPPNTVSFNAGPGSCGAQEIGPSVGWQRPLNGYTITRGYAEWHPGIDLAASVGAPVMAANSGRVIFAGWSDWGYGYTVVLSSGPFQTLYGHLSAVNVRCGQVVSIGQVIGAVGSTGNSSGPHLHFELMYNGIRGNPAATIPF